MYNVHMQQIAAFEIIDTKSGIETFVTSFTIRYETMFPPMSVAIDEARRNLSMINRRFTKTMVVRTR